MKRAILLSITILSLNLIDATAADWPEFRGPGAQGHADGEKLPIEFGADKNLKWKVPVPGSGWSTPAIVKGKIYLTSALTVGDGFSLNALCLDATTGRIAWNHPLIKVAKATRTHRKNSQASPSPIVSGNRIFAHFGHMGTVCLDLDGKIIWKNETLKYSSVHGNGGTPVLVNGNLIFSCDGSKNPFVVALDAKNGKIVWRVNRSVNAKRKFSFSTPLVLRTGTGTQLLLPGSDMIGAYHPDTGKEIWRATFDGYSVVPRPVVGHGMVFFSTGFDRAKAIAVKLGGKGDVTDSHLAWTLTKGAPHTPSMLLVGTELYMVSDGGIGSCIEAKTGKVIWSERFGGGHSASPIYADGKIYFTNESGVVTVVTAGKKFTVLAKNKLGERALASPAVADGALFIRTAEHLWKFQQ
jgi:outer membrane protein assembly factor BamB